MRVPHLAAVVFVSLFGVAPAAHAVPVLLTSAYQTQLETWLGQGNLTFTNIFEKQTGDDSADFHAAADGKGATFTLMQAVFQGSTYVVGGYNPQSWSTIGTFNLTPLDAQRTGFIYNLTTGVKQSQRLSTDTFGANLGASQTYNDTFNGPTFGAGLDLSVTSALSGGNAIQHSYGNPTTSCGIHGVNIFGTSFANADCSQLDLGNFPFTIGALEVYTFAAAPAVDAAVPEPATLTLLGLGLASAAARRFRRKK